jgi:copper oxidase (laccase) domain-containing protein
MSTRDGGASVAPWNSMNLGGATGDDAEAVARNRLRFAEAMGATPVFLKQVHGIRVARITHVDAEPSSPQLQADASVTTERGLACAVLVADCLPVLMCAPEGRAPRMRAGADWPGASSRRR